MLLKQDRFAATYAQWYHVCKIKALRRHVSDLCTRFDDRKCSVTFNTNSFQTLYAFYRLINAQAMPLEFRLI